jgi:hypothetical protein
VSGEYGEAIDAVSFGADCSGIVVLGNDLLLIAAATLLTRVDMTIVGGKVVSPGSGPRRAT